MATVQARVSATGMDLDEIVSAAIATACHVDRSHLTPASHLVDLGLDSMSLLSIIVQIREYASFELNDAGMARLFECATLGEVVAYLRGLTGEPSR